MIEQFKYIFFVYSISLFYNIDSCKISDKNMDCSGLNLTDCPPFNSTILKLNLDNNFLKSLNTENCTKWIKIMFLSLENNLLEDVSNMDKFISLSTLNLKKNRITEIEFISQQSLLSIDISFNSIKSFKKSTGLPSLETFNASHNEIDNNSFKQFINFLVKSPNLQTLVFDYNKLSTLSADFMSFTNIKMKYFGLSGNEFHTFDFGEISSNLKNGFTIDLSNNNMTHLKINGNRTVAALNLSNNLLTKIDGSKLEMLQGLKSIDLSNNPLNCLCNESASFIDWVNQHSTIFVNRDKTFCKYSLKNESIFTIRCPQVTTVTPFPTTVTSVQPRSTTTMQPTNSGKKSLVITISVLVPLSFIIISFLVMLVYRKRRYYSLINGSGQSNLMFLCNCIPMVSLRTHSSEADPLITEEDNHGQYLTENARLNFENKLNIICALKDVNWVRTEIADHLPIAKDFISYTTNNLPRAEYTLIIVHGKASLEDLSFVTNVQKALENSNNSDIRLLLGYSMDVSSVNKKNPLLPYITRELEKKTHFSYSYDINKMCITGLKLWLNLNNVPHNV